METVSALLRVLLALGAAAPARALYLYDDSPAAGYVVAAADEHRKVPAHKRYHMGAAGLGNMKLVNERAVDSYFRILRPTPPPAAAASAAATEPPPHRERPQSAYAPARDRPRDGEGATAGVGADRIKPRNDGELSEQNRREYFRKHSVYEKHTVVSRGSKRHGRRPHLAQNYDQKLFPTQARGDVGYEPSGAALPDRSRYAKEYRKRNTIDKESVPRRMDEHRNPLVHYMNAEDAYKTIGRRVVPARSGPSAPHALFYRASQEAEPAHGALQDAGGAYYRGSASNYVDLNVGRKGPAFIA